MTYPNASLCLTLVAKAVAIEIESYFAPTQIDATKQMAECTYTWTHGFHNPGVGHNMFFNKVFSKKFKT